MLYLLYIAGEFLVLTLPLKASYWLADTLGSLYYFLAKKDKKILANNLRVVLNRTDKTPPYKGIGGSIPVDKTPPYKGIGGSIPVDSSAKIPHISRMVFVNFARYLVEFFRSPKIDLKYIEENIEIQGRENLEKALSSGKGALLLSAHLGNWELGAVVLAILGYKINIVAWTHKNKMVNDFFLRQRRSKGVKVIPLGAGIRRTFSALRKNELIGLLGDIDYNNPEMGITVELFGRDTVMPKGPAALSLKTACPIIPTFMLREGEGRFKFILEKPIIYNSSQNQRYALAELTQRLAKTLESYIALYPEQWFMLTPRW